MPEAMRVTCRLRELLLRRRHGPESLLRLVESRGHEEPDEQRDDAEQRRVVEKDADASRHAVPVQSLHTGPHRGGEDDPDEDQADQQPELPERKRADDDRHRDESDDERLTGSLPEIRLTTHAT